MTRKFKYITIMCNDNPCYADLVNMLSDLKEDAITYIGDRVRRSYIIGCFTFVFIVPINETKNDTPWLEIYKDVTNESNSYLFDECDRFIRSKGGK